MIAYEVYKLVHYLGIILVTYSLGAYSFHVLRSGHATFMGKRWLAIGHGFGLFLILLGGFGMLARLGLVQGLPTWVWIKLAIWLLLGAVISFVKRKPKWNAWLWFFIISMILVAAGTALYKPFIS